MFAIKVKSVEVVGGTECGVITKDDEEFWVTNEREGWVEATSSRTSLYPGKVPADLKVFKTKAIAEAFGLRWEGHPWWCKPKSFEVVEVEPLYEKITGYKLKT